MTTPFILLGLLILPYIVLAWVPAFKTRPALRGCVGIALVFVLTGVIGHLLWPGSTADMIPPAVPYRLELVYLSGVVEIAAGLAVLIPACRVAAGWFLIAMLACLLPFNIYSAIERVGPGGHAWGPVYLWIRVPLQLILALWCYWFAAKRTPGP